MDENCTVYKTVNVLSKKWNLLIIQSVYKSKNYTKRYTEIKKDLAEITPKILSQRLSELEQEGLITKEIDSSKVPIKSFYTLTNSGRELINVVKGMKNWGLKWKFPSDACERTRCRNCRL